MTERFTENIINKVNGEILGYRIKGGYAEYSNNKLKALQKLGELETAEEDGRLVVLPCRTVYFIHNKAIRTKSILDLLLWEIDGIDKGGEHWSTREKAEKALKEMEEKQSE